MNIHETNLPKLSLGQVADTLKLTVQAIHKQLKKNNIVCPKLGNKSYITHEIAKKLFNLTFSKQKICFQIVKGGTGKTTAIHNISCAASLYGAKILIVDIDPQGNATDAFGVNADDVPVLIDLISTNEKINNCIVNATQGIDIIPSRIENVVLDNKLALDRIALHTFFSNVLEPIENEYDFIFFDCPPTMGHSVTAASLYTKKLLVPLNPDKFSAKGLSILKGELLNLKMNYKIEVDYKVFLNKFIGNTILSDKAISTTVAEEMQNDNALHTAIRQSQEIPNITDAGGNLFCSLKKSTAREDFDLLT